MPKEIYIIGAGTYGEAMYELAELTGYTVKGFYDEDATKLGQIIQGCSVLGKFSELCANEVSDRSFIVAIGNNAIRFKIMESINRINGLTPTLIHPTAFISKSAKIGKGVYIQAGAHIWTKAEIEDYCIISPNVVIAHHSKVGKACLVSTLSAIGASIDIGNYVFVGMGATIMTGVKFINNDTTVGAGAVVTKDINEEGGTFVGVPARKIN